MYTENEAVFSGHKIIFVSYATSTFKNKCFSVCCHEFIEYCFCTKESIVDISGNVIRSYKLKTASNLEEITIQVLKIYRVYNFKNSCFEICFSEFNDPLFYFC